MKKQRSQSKFSREVLQLLWDLYQSGRAIEELAPGAGTSARGLRAAFAKSGLRAGVWSDAELHGLHREHLAGGYVSELAKRRRRKTADLVKAWLPLGLKPIARKDPVQPKRIPAERVAAMYDFYQTGATFAEVERRFGVGKAGVRSIFLGRGLAIREPIANAWRHKRTDGTWQAMPPKTAEEIEELIQAATKIAVPVELKLEWRKWDLEKRVDFIRRLRARLGNTRTAPTGPFCEGMVPFDYGTPAAWEIIRRLNADTNSRTWRAKLNIISEGVIYDGLLWFWSQPFGAYYRRAGKADSERYWVVLPRHVWRKEHGRIPAGWLVRIRDGNPNNMDPANLYLATKNDVARENQASALSRKSRERTALILSKSQQKGSHHVLIDQLTPS
jgi:hypothetical protein